MEQIRQAFNNMFSSPWGRRNRSGVGDPLAHFHAMTRLRAQLNDWVNNVEPSSNHANAAEAADRIFAAAADRTKTKLDLGSLNLSTLPVEIGQLSHLNELVLRDNPQLTVLPAHIYENQNWRMIDVSFTGVPPNDVADLNRRLGSRCTISSNNLSRSANTNNGRQRTSNMLNFLRPHIDIASEENQQWIAAGGGEQRKEALERLSKLSRKATTLDLSGLHLTELPPQLVTYPKLESLDLTGNCIAQFPDEIGLLINIKYVTLCENDLARIPDSVSKLPSGCVVDISNNPLLTRDDLVTLAIALGASGYDGPTFKNDTDETLRSAAQLCDGLREWLQYASGTEGTATIARVIKKIYNCQQDQSRTLDFSGLNIKTLPVAIGDLKHLEELNLNGNPDFFSENNRAKAHDNPQFFSLKNTRDLPNIKSVNLSNNNIFNVHALTHNDLSGDLPSRCVIDIDGNGIANEYLPELANSMTQAGYDGPIFKINNTSFNAVLNEVFFTWKNEQGLSSQEKEGRCRAYDVIQRCRRDNSGNLSLDNLALTALPDHFGLLPNLTTLDLSNNPLTHLPSSIFTLPAACKVKLSPNPINDKDLLRLAAQLDSNRSNGSRIEFDPALLQRLRALQKREAHKQSEEKKFLNSLSAWASGDAEKIKAKDAIIECKRTFNPSLDLSYLSLVNLPPEIGQLTHVEELDLSFNKLRTLPESILNLPELAQLNLNTNHLVGHEGVIQIFDRINHPVKINIGMNAFVDRDIVHMQDQMSQSDMHTPQYTFSKNQTIQANALRQKLEAEREFVEILNAWAGQNPHRMQAIEKIKSCKADDCPALDLSGLSLDSLPDVFAKLKQLREINLSNNQFGLGSALMGLGRRNVNCGSNPIRSEEIIRLQDLMESRGYAGPKFIFSSYQMSGAAAERNVQAKKAAEQEKRAHAERVFNAGLDRWAAGQLNKKQAAEEIKLAWQNPQNTTLVLEGFALRDLPPEITQLTHLKKLDLSGNQLVNLPVGMDRLGSLIKLNLAGNRLTVIDPSVMCLARGCQVDVSGNVISAEEIDKHQSNMRRTQYKGPHFQFSERQKASAEKFSAARAQREKQAEEQARQQRENQSRQEAQQRAEQEARQRAHDKEVRRAQAEAARLASEVAERARQRAAEEAAERLQRDPLNENVEPMAFSLGSNGRLLYVHDLSEKEVAEYVTRIVSGGVSGEHIARLRRDFFDIVKHGGSDECDWFLRRYENVFDPRRPINGANALREYSKLIKALAPHDPTLRRAQG
ncbi:MAG: hypothetical protein H7252_04040 [Cytophaga sp.]|nr:hypothetical protein [Undibacterium sp.]